jgi:hypothetical protein
MKVRELIKILQRDYKPDETVVYSLWSKEDVRGVIDDRFKVTDEECYAILEIFLDRQDCGEGLNWDTLKEAIEDYRHANPQDPIVELMDKVKEEHRSAPQNGSGYGV